MTDPTAPQPQQPPVYPATPGYAPAPGYQQPGYPQGYAPGYATGPRTNTLSIVALVLAFVVSLGAVICGHIALGQIKRTGEGGHGLALAAVILGYVGIAFGVIVVTSWIVLIFVGAAAGAEMHSTY